MQIKRKITINNNKYIIYFDVEYKTSNIKDVPELCFKNDEYGFFDGGDVSELLALVEKNYHEIKFNKNIGFMNNVIYIYRCVPVLSAIEEVTSVDICFISRKEIDEFINRFNIDFNFNDDFKLSDHSTWKF